MKKVVEIFVFPFLCDLFSATSCHFAICLRRFLSLSWRKSLSLFVLIITNRRFRVSRGKYFQVQFKVSFNQITCVKVFLIECTWFVRSIEGLKEINFRAPSILEKGSVRKINLLGNSLNFEFQKQKEFVELFPSALNLNSASLAQTFFRFLNERTAPQVIPSWPLVLLLFRGDGECFPISTDFHLFSGFWQFINSWEENSQLNLNNLSGYE